MTHKTQAATAPPFLDRTRWALFTLTLSLTAAVLSGCAGDKQFLASEIGPAVHESSSALFKGIEKEFSDVVEKKGGEHFGSEATQDLTRHFHR